MSKQATEKMVKELEVNKLAEVLEANGYEMNRVDDYATFAFPVEIDGEVRYMTMKLVLTKALDDEKGVGYDIDEHITAYEDRVKADAEKEVAKAEKKEKALADKASREAKAKAKKEKEKLEKETK